MKKIWSGKKTSKLKSKTKQILLFLSLLYLTLYIPFTITAYSKSWYETNYEKQSTYQTLGIVKTNNQTNNLINFFLHKQELNQLWSEKETLHLKEVRNIYDLLFIIFLITTPILILFFNKKIINHASKKNTYIIPSLLIIIPFFRLFWNNILHPLLFNNNYWINTPNEVSYHLFPTTFFINSILFIITISAIINFTIYLLTKKKKQL